MIEVCKRLLEVAEWRRHHTAIFYIEPFAFSVRASLDVEVTEHYNYFRDYEPSIGRYIESDPIGLRGGLNTFGYVDANPVKNTDPTGLIPPGADADCFRRGECKCVTAECAAGLQPSRSPEFPPEVCFAGCMAAKAIGSLGFAYGWGRAAQGVGGVAGKIMSNMNSTSTAAGQSIIIGSELTAYEYCVKKCPGKVPETCPASMGGLNAP